MALKGNPGDQFSPTEYSTLWEDQVNSVLTTKILRPPPLSPQAIEDLGDLYCYIEFSLISEILGN